MYIINKIRNKINENFEDKSWSNIEKVNAKLNTGLNTNSDVDGETILFI